MPSVTEHYESHLAPVYLWMAGGFDAAVVRGQAEIDTVCPRPTNAGTAVDLGAGFGMHAIPLARHGYSVLAIDSSNLLLEVLDKHVGTLPIKTVRDDLLTLKRQLDAPASLIVCMGDTLTHLPDRKSVQNLFAHVVESLEDAGTFIVTFRDYASALTGSKRFIPVRSDADRILTCFLEYDEETVMVHDILHERDGEEWHMSVSAYPKLRLPAQWVIDTLETYGLQVKKEQGLGGMVRLIAKRLP